MEDNPASQAPAAPASARAATVATFVLALTGMLLARYATWHALGDVPHVMDEVAYTLQAKTLAAFELVSPVGLPRGAFTMWFVDDRAARFSIFPPGWPLLLAAGLRLHATPWVNPLLHGGTTLLVAAIARKLGGPRAQVIAAAIYALSPQTLALAASFMSHALVAATAAVVTWVVVQLHARVVRARDLVLAGVALGLCAGTRPLCALALLVFFAGAVLLLRVPLRRLWPAAVPLVAAVVLLGAYNARLTGSVSRFPQSYYFDEHAPPVNLPVFAYKPGCNDLGFGPGHGCEYSIRNATHDFANALSNTGDNLRAWFLLLGGGPLVFAAVAYELFATRKKRSTLMMPALLALPAVLVIGLYALYWYAGTCYGARFYHAAVPPLLVVAALGLARLPRRIVFGVVMTAWMGWGAFAGWHVEREISGQFWGTDARFARVAHDWKDKDALVMVAFTSKMVPIDSLYWTTSLLRKGGKWLNSIRSLGALGQNGANFEGPVVFAKFHPGLVDALREHFPGRELWLYVAAPDAAQDRLERYSPDLLPLDEPLFVPPENFDGYKVDGEPRQLREKATDEK